MRNVSPTSGGRIFSCDLRPDPAAASERRLPKIHGSHRAASCTCGLILRLSFEDLSPTATGTNHAQTYRLILDEIRRADYNVFTRRARLRRRDKLRVAAGAVLRSGLKLT